MRILMVNKFHYIKGGTETYINSVTKGLESAGHSVFHFAMNDENNLPYEYSDYFVPHVDYNAQHGLAASLKIAKNLIYSKESLRRFDSFINLVKPDIIHLNLVHRQITLSILDSPAATNIPIVYTSHEYIPICPSYTLIDGKGRLCEKCIQGNFYHCFFSKCIKESRLKSLLGAIEAYFIRYRKFYDRFSIIIAPSNYMKSKLIESGIGANRIKVMPNCFDINLWEEAGKREGKEITPYFVYFGRLSKEKGVSLLLSAFAQFNKLHPNWRLCIVGDGPERAELESVASELNIHNSVFFTGKMEGESLRKIVAKARYSVVCSNWPETFGYNILESEAAGTPVIGSRIGAIPDNVIDGFNGMTFAPNDSSQLADTLRQAASLDESNYCRLRDNGIEHACSVSNIETYTDNLLDLYRNAVDRLNNKKTE